MCGYAFFNVLTSFLYLYAEVAPVNAPYGFMPVAGPQPPVVYQGMAGHHVAPFPGYVYNPVPQEHMMMNATTLVVGQPSQPQQQPQYQNPDAHVYVKEV